MADRVYFTKAPKFQVNSGEGKPTTLVGYAIVWNAISSDRGGYQVKLLPGSARFAATVLALRGHDFNEVLGSTANGTLRISSDDYGVRVEIDLPDTAAGRDAAVLVRRGDMNGMSFSMANGPEKSTAATVDGKQILSVELFTVDEVTVTAIPAFRETNITHKPDPSPGFRDALAERHRFDAFRLLP